ncbi:unnamed protein product, partial [Didymodactylos carnosus]
KDQKPKSHDEKTGEKPKDDHKHEPHHDEKPKDEHKHEPHHDEKDVKKTVKINHESHHIVAKDDKTLEGTLIVKNCDHKSLKDDKKSVGHEIEKKVNSHLRDQHKVNQEVKIDVHDVEELNSTHSALHYKCHGGEKEHHEKIKTSLKDSCKHDDVRISTAFDSSFLLRIMNLTRAIAEANLRDRHMKRKSMAELELKRGPSGNRPEALSSELSRQSLTYILSSGE